jgi:hypothetical protein
VHGLKRGGYTVIQGNGRSDGCQWGFTFFPRESRGQWLFPAAPALFPFKFFLLFLFPLHSNINGRNDKGPFLPG